MKISFFEIQGWEKPNLKKGLPKQNLTFYQEPLSLKNISLVKNSGIVKDSRTQNRLIKNLAGSIKKILKELI